MCALIITLEFYEFILFKELFIYYVHRALSAYMPAHETKASDLIVNDFKSPCGY